MKDIAMKHPNWKSENELIIIKIGLASQILLFKSVSLPTVTNKYNSTRFMKEDDRSVCRNIFFLKQEESCKKWRRGELFFIGSQETLT